MLPSSLQGSKKWALDCWAGRLTETDLSYLSKKLHHPAIAGLPCPVDPQNLLADWLEHEEGLTWNTKSAIIASTVVIFEESLLGGVLTCCTDVTLQKEIP